MDKVSQAVAAIKAAEAAVKDVVNPLNITIMSGRTDVLVKTSRDLEQIPGESVFKHTNGMFALIEEKELGGIKFTAYLGHDEAAERGLLNKCQHCGHLMS
jgi:hypothetical protein